ncbi:coproporphyrinogen III oxidase family protein [Slackia equolifaciens]|uniref:Heme chaperone HemW n=1 Tax=Slackia equolifaciens TaxID=498718 RepID=A0A3N0AVD5_9ACTN|nr:coproporphyrinogen III oxidase family protein [Slackia equolifaciens]RNL38833.1 coproporphyrinogen III oxidase family protein [Slackia equolifaciens]HJF65064.1 coproporphyrinogen III oxidase family protein [Slackia equolifaciens]
MLSERLLTRAVRYCADSFMKIEPCRVERIPGPKPGQPYMLYAHIPFCERLCPYCSFNRFPFSEKRAVPYFKNLRRELMMVKELGYDFDSLYIGGGTPTIMLDELCDFIDLAKREFSIKEVSCETNPNHLTLPYLEKLQGRVDRMSVGVQSFDDDLLRQMDRYEKYGDGKTILESIKVAAPYFKSLNVDMIFNFPAQTEEVLRRDLEMVIESGTSQTTFYPLMASPSVEKSLARTVGKVDYDREQHFYEIISETLAGGANAPFEHGSAWTFNKREASVAPEDAMIDEYIVDYEEYPAIGSGGMTYLGDTQYVNTFSIRDYNAAIESGRMSVMGKATFSKHNRMRYRFMMQLFGLRLDKKQWERDFGCSVAGGLPVEYAFMKMSGAFDRDDDECITLTPKGRYLMVVMMRQFFIGVNNLRDQARAALPEGERQLLFGSGCAECK